MVFVWDTNWSSFEAFTALDTQWHMQAIHLREGGLRFVRTGLDYAGVDVVLRRRRADDHVFDDIQVMELAALVAFAEAAQ